MTRFWNQDSEPSSITRTGRTGLPYAIHHESRFVPSNVDRPRNGSRGYQDTAEGTEDQNKQNQRRRIPIACGRCRKRKIRCSGPQGDSGCQNCKSVGNDNCQFNRVQSLDMQMRTDNLFAYDTMAAERMGIRGPQYHIAPSYPTMSGMVPLGSNMQFRQLPSNYPFPSKQASYGSQYPSLDYAEDMNDYNNIPFHQPLHHESVDIGYGSGNVPPQRALTPLPGHKSYSSMNFYEPSSTYPQTTQQPQQLYHHTGQSFPLPLRSSISRPDNHFNFNNMASTLPVPSPMTSHVRALPMPMARPAPRYNDGIVYSNGSTANLPQPTDQAAVKDINTSVGQSASTNNNGGYVGISTSPDGTITSNSSFESGSSHPQGDNMYSSSGEWSNDGIPENSASNNSLAQTQHHMNSQMSSQQGSHVAPMPLTTRRSHADLEREIDNYNAAAYNASAGMGSNPLNSSITSSIHDNNNDNDNSPSSSQPLVQHIPAIHQAPQVPQHTVVNARKLSNSHSLQHASFIDWRNSNNSLPC